MLISVAGRNSWYNDPLVPGKAVNCDRVLSPIDIGQLCVCVGTELNCDTGKRRMVSVAFHQLGDHTTHSLLDLGVQGVVVGTARASSAVHLPPGLAAGISQFNGTTGGFVLPPKQRFEFRQGRGQRQGGHQPKPFAIEQTKEHLQDIFLLRVLGGAKEDAVIVPGRRFQQTAGIDGRSVAQHRDHGSIVAHVLQVLDQPRPAVQEGVPIVQIAPGYWVDGIAGREVLREQRAVQVGGQQPEVLAPRDLPNGQCFWARQDADLAENGRCVLPKVRQQQQRRWRRASWPIHNTMKFDLWRCHVAGCRYVQAGMGPQRPDHAGGALLDDVDAERLHEVIRICQIQHVRNARFLNRQSIRLPAFGQQLDELVVRMNLFAATAVSHPFQLVARIRTGDQGQVA